MRRLLAVIGRSWRQRRAELGGGGGAQHSDGVPRLAKHWRRWLQLHAKPPPTTGRSLSPELHWPNSCAIGLASPSHHRHRPCWPELSYCLHRSGHLPHSLCFPPPSPVVRYSGTHSATKRHRSPSTGALMSYPSPSLLLLDLEKKKPKERRMKEEGETEKLVSLLTVGPLAQIVKDW
uniref:Uncharacterized protein n=1 Tax=Oryza meridionalis TaxID=40149 RepID=A0A0E0CQ91_9ORYZ